MTSARQPRYRAPGSDDADALAALGRATFIETFGRLYARDDLEAFLTRAFGPAGLPRELADPLFDFRVAEADGRMLAYAKLGPLRVPVDARGRRAVELRQLYVLKPWQGSGVSQELMHWALARARARGAQDLFLSVYAENWRAQRFYAGFGFVEVGTYKFMVGNHADDELILKLALDECQPAAGPG